MSVEAGGTSSWTVGRSSGYHLQYPTAQLAVHKSLNLKSKRYRNLCAGPEGSWSL